MVRNFPVAQKKKTALDAAKTTSKKAIQKSAEATGDLIGNKIADKITSVSKNSSTKLPSAELRSQNKEANDDLETPKDRCISLEKRQQLLMN